jgi:hypothetical protein
MTSKELGILGFSNVRALFSTIGPHRESRQEPTFIFKMKNSFGNV